MQRRMRVHFLEEGWRYDVIDAILGAQGSNPAATKRAVEQLSKHVEHKIWKEVLEAYARCVRITRDLDKT
ncbi:MAG: hypothetical protein GTN65_16170, partial [Armatimonadetes bacterium]|nr:hypothetical protein [Armatimonadota bacterium]NIO98586.1 hypothetical protein [Armatimonadota bacterium]